MAKLNPLLQLALLDQLGVVDGSELLRRNGDANTPENIPPVGVERTTKDTGSPSNGFFKGLRGDDPASQAVTAGVILLGLAGLVAVIRAVF